MDRGSIAGPVELFGVGWQAIVSYGHIHIDFDPDMDDALAAALDTLLAPSQRPFWEGSYGADSPTVSGWETWSVDRKGQAILDDTLGLVIGIQPPNQLGEKNLA